MNISVTRSVFKYRLSPFFISSTLLICFLLFSEAGAVEFSNEEKAYLATHPVIRVHNEMDWPPFNFNYNGKPSGLSIDVMNLIAELSGLKIIYVSGPNWEEFMQMMAEKRLDVMLNIVDLPERRELLSFTTPYAKSLTGVYTKNENSRRYFNFRDLAGRTVAVPAGFDLEINLPKYHSDLKVLSVKDTLACIDAVLSGRADAFMEELGVVDYIRSQRMLSDIRLAFQVNEDPFISNLTIATRRDNETLYGVIQKSLNSISDDELYRIRQKWLLNVIDLYEKSMVHLTVEEKEYLYHNNQVDICVDPSWPPLDFITEDGVHSGLSADLIQTLSKRIGVTVRLIPTKTWNQSLQYLREERCEVIPLMNETLESKSFINFSYPYFDFPTVIAARSDASFIGDYSELYGRTVALQAHFFITEYVRKNHPDINIIEVENTREALKLVSGQKAFATIDGLPTVVNTIEALALENIKIVGSVPQENRMKLGVRKGNELLLSVFNKGIESLSDKDKIGLYRKWFDIEIEKQLFNKSLIVKAGAVVACILILLLWRQFVLGRYARKLKILNEKLLYTATFDHLTEIFNRKSIEKRLVIEIEKSELSGEPLSLVILDVDHFKSINDSFGHLTGDTVLKSIAESVRTSIRKSDHCGRWGGEEFLIVFPNTHHSDTERIVNLLRIRIAEQDFGLNRPVTVSMGIGQLRKKEKVSSFISRVDAALYAAKEGGRNRVANAEISETE